MNQFYRVKIYLTYGLASVEYSRRLEASDIASAVSLAIRELAKDLHEEVNELKGAIDGMEVFKCG